MTDETQRRLDRLEQRLQALERRLTERGDPAPPAADAEPAPRMPEPVIPAAPVEAARDVYATSVDAASAAGRSLIPTVTGLMASGAAAAFVLAAVYFLKLVYDTGWLTPERQLAGAVLGGAALIGAGVGLARHDRRYASWLPAAGVVIHYLTVYTAHLYYRLVGVEVVLAGVAVVTLTAVWLHRTFQRSIYALAAVVGAYSMPVLMPSESPLALDLVLYFAAWAMLFAWVALLDADRTIYSLALWLAVLGFDIAWRTSAASDAWVAAASFHFAQFVFFAAVATRFSIVHRRPLRNVEALFHGGALFVFYGVEYALLSEFAPRLASPLALASVVVVIGAYLFARARLGDDRSDAGAVMTSAYVSFVTAHVVFFELLPREWFGWGVLVLPLALRALNPLAREVPSAMVVPRLVSGALMILGFMTLLIADGDGTDAPLPFAALYLYAAFLYAGAALLRRDRGRHQHPPVLLYAGHLAFMVATVRAFDSALAISVVWALLAVSLLVVALRWSDPILGRSSLLIYSASAAKVVLYDLDGSPSAVRVGILLVLGASLYLGGWLYRRIEAPAAPSD